MNTKRKKRLSQITKHKLTGILFVAPWIIGFLVFTLMPFFQTLQYSFSTVRFLPNGIKTAFVGLDNFAQVLFTDPKFKLAIPGYLKQMFIFVPMVLVFSIIISVLLNTKIRGKRFFRAIYFLPVILMSGPVVTNLVAMDATTLSGVQDFFVYEFIAENFPAFLSMPILYIFDNSILFLWFSGVQVLIFLSGLQKTDKSVYEAARVDGASPWQQFWKITVVDLKPFIFLNAIYTIVDVSTSNINEFIYIIEKSMFDGTKGFGFAAAATWIFFFMIVAAVLVAFLLLGRSGDKKKTARRRAS